MLSLALPQPAWKGHQDLVTLEWCLWLGILTESLRGISHLTLTRRWAKSYCWNILTSASSDPFRQIAVNAVCHQVRGRGLHWAHRTGWMAAPVPACQHMLLGVAEFSLRSAFILTYYLGSRYKPSTTSNSSVSNCLPWKTKLLESDLSWTCSQRG